MKTLSLVLFATALNAQYQAVPSTNGNYPALEAILNAKPAVQVFAGVPPSNKCITPGFDLAVNISASPNVSYFCTAAGWVQFGSGGTWGSIGGTLSNQTDLQAALAARLLSANNLSDLASASTARTNLGLGTAAAQSSAAFAPATSGTVPLKCNGSGGTTPIPRKLRNDSCRIACGTVNVA